MTGFEKLFFHLKALQTRMQIDVNKFFVAQVVPEIYSKNNPWINLCEPNCSEEKGNDRKNKKLP